MTILATWGRKGLAEPTEELNCTRRMSKPKQKTGTPVVAARRQLGFLVVSYGLAFALGGVAVAGVILTRGQPQPAPVKSARPSPSSHYDLLAMSPEELGKLDIAVVNLLCAKGLPGAEDADHYNHSEARLRAEFIVQCLQEDCGVHYNVDRVNTPDFRNSKDMFIHGMIDSANGGTCASMPVMYVAIGRRLGYPMKLALAKQRTRHCRSLGSQHRGLSRPEAAARMVFVEPRLHRRHSYGCRYEWEARIGGI